VKEGTSISSGQSQAEGPLFPQL